MTKVALPLPLISSAPETVADWHGFTPLSSVSAEAAPEPAVPQGEYAAEHEISVPLLNAATAAGRAELLAPAGGPDAAFAALHYGADAIYLGLKKFSARAEAENFTIDELSEITAYA